MNRSGRYSGKKILVVGLAKSGCSACLFLYNAGAHVTAYDAMELKYLDPAARRLPEDIAIRAGVLPEKIDVCQYDEIIVSPGIIPSNTIVVNAVSAGVAVVSEMEIGLRALPAVRLVAVTGTNGKTTTCSLIEHLTGGKLAGNIGTPLTSLTGLIKENDILILEVSSYQAVFTPSLVPDVAVLLNIFPEHLSWHGDFEAYTAAKKKVFAGQTPEKKAVFNWNMPDIDRFTDGLRASMMYFSISKNTAPGVCLIDNDMVYIDETGRKKRIASIDGIHIKGVHNLENMLAAACVWICLHGDRDDLPSFEGYDLPPHRMQTVMEHGGVRFVDDSKATNMHSVYMALRSADAPLVLLMGGRSKGQMHPGIKDIVRDKVKRLVLFGESAPELKEYLEDTVPFSVHSGLREAVRDAFDSAQPGMTVLLSPGGSSFDEFSSYAERGEKFAEWLEKEVRQ